MDSERLMDDARRARERLPGEPPCFAFILGSGWSDAVSGVSIEATVPYNAIPSLGPPAVAGHPGRLLVGACRGARILVFQGRRHWYEGLGWDPIAFPIFLCREMGVPAVVLTNAAGGIREDLAPGDLMIVEDHINAMGVNPLVGGVPPVWGRPAFPDQTAVYHTALRALLAAAARDAGAPVRRGVYLSAAGPAYETPAEVTAFRTMGADAVGMSTVPEAMLARAAGMRVGAISCITNRAAGSAAAPLSHDEVLAVTSAAAPRLRAVIEHVCRRRARSEPADA